MPQQPSPPTLPFELVQEIIQSLNGEDDRPTLLSFLRVSKACWETAAHVLYRTILLTKDRTERLFLTGGEDMAVVTESPESRLVHLSPRTRRALSFIERVELKDIEPEHIYLLWAATTPDTPLFPNARQVCLRHFRGRWPNACQYPQKDVPQDVDIFGHIDLCVEMELAFRYIEYLPVQKYKRVSIHNVWSPRFSMTPYPDEWEELRWFEFYAQTFASKVVQRFDEAEAFLDDIDPDGKLPPLTYVVPTDEWEDLTLGSLSKERGWVPSPTSRIQFTFDSADWRAPPCVVCGKKFDWPQDTVVSYKGAPHTFRAG
ncbi:uncharacterized protein LOC62_05G007196 [Vanrija pseudolonga]|uniref:F-box domain-containing protein n=1 Tax=Vanrija pseudolonga TaxID=143232 RepID=A0AAF0YF21_9TREE|nr:hypothetical protein LOC62_05G007196 [Vanrija pseudolonga]